MTPVETEITRGTRRMDTNMCHEATSVGLPESIGIGKGTVLLEDFDTTDAIFVIGKTPEPTVRG